MCEAVAEELGFTPWLYDQIRFSGANFQGRLVAAPPGFHPFADPSAPTRAAEGS